MWRRPEKRNPYPILAMWIQKGRSLLDQDCFGFCCGSGGAFGAITKPKGRESPKHY